MHWGAALQPFPQGGPSFGIYNKIFRREEENGQIRDA